jgi:hypothetical protein
MSGLWSFRHGVRLSIAGAIVAALIFTLPWVVSASITRAQGLSTCSDGSQSFSGCGGAGIGYCGGALGAGQACSGPGVRTASPGCTGAVCVPLASMGVAASSGYTYSPLNTIYTPYTPASYGPTAGSRASYAGASWRPCTVQGRGFVWLPAGVTASAGALC